MSITDVSVSKTVPTMYSPRTFGHQPKGTYLRLRDAQSPSGVTTLCLCNERGEPLLGGNLVTITRSGRLHLHTQIDDPTGSLVLTPGREMITDNDAEMMKRVTGLIEPTDLTKTMSVLEERLKSNETMIVDQGRTIDRLCNERDRAAANRSLLEHQHDDLVRKLGQAQEEIRSLKALKSGGPRKKPDERIDRADIREMARVVSGIAGDLQRELEHMADHSGESVMRLANIQERLSTEYF